jgi:hypothetical protein
LRVVAGEFECRGDATFVWAPDPMLRPPCVGPTLVRYGNYSCEWVVGDEAETTRANKQSEVWRRGSRVRRKVVVEAAC